MTSCSTGVSFARGRRPSLAIEGLTPLIDIVFLLLLFFALSFSVAREQVIRVALPAAASARADEAGPILLQVTRDGRFVLATRAIAEAGLVEALRDALAGAPRQAVRIEADREAAVAAAVRALDAARLAGAEAATIATVSVAETPAEIESLP